MPQGTSARLPCPFPSPFKKDDKKMGSPNFFLKLKKWQKNSNTFNKKKKIVLLYFTE
jgi:hypothetical protein